jgi:hypothetical protein
MGQLSLVHRNKLATTVASLAGVLVLVTGLFVWGVAGKSSPSSAAATTSACTTANLDVWLNTTGNGAAGSSYYNLNLTNLSPRSCTLYGYPGVSAITQAGIQLGSSAGRVAQHAATTITLTSGRTAQGFERTSHNTATVIVQITVAENFPSAQCSPITAAGLRVYPPGQKDSTVVPFPFVACAKTGPQFLHAESVQRFVSAP